MAEDTATSLAREQELLLIAAHEAPARRAASTVYGPHGGALRQTLLALLAGAELAAHEGPPAATLQVLSGRIRLIAGERSWELAAGELIGIPPERHSVDAIEDSTFLLTVLRATQGSAS